jgi:hypothetical protein
MPKETIVRPGAAASGCEPAHGLQVGWNRLGWVQVSAVPHGWESTGDWSIVDMDHDSINRLIRVLRRARDQAFGRDE